MHGDATSYCLEAILNKSFFVCAARKIDVMMLYNEGGKDKLGGISDAQMQTTLATALSSSNEAFARSGINLEFTLVYVGLVRVGSDKESASLRK